MKIFALFRSATIIVSYLFYYSLYMRTQLTVKLQKIANVASSYSKEIFNQYLREENPKRATMLCTLRGALDARISHVQEVIFVSEFGQKWRNVVTEKERKKVDYALPSPLVQKAYKSVAHIVDKIMFLAKQHVENNIIWSFQPYALA